MSTSNDFKVIETGRKATGGCGILTIINVVLAILINIPTPMRQYIHDFFGYKGIGNWIFNCLEGWTCILWIIFSPLLFAIIIASALFIVGAIAAVIYALIFKSVTK